MFNVPPFQMVHLLFIIKRTDKWLANEDPGYSKIYSDQFLIKLIWVLYVVYLWSFLYILHMQKAESYTVSKMF
jgi:hypothetical protein